MSLFDAFFWIEPVKGPGKAPVRTFLDIMLMSQVSYVFVFVFSSFKQFIIFIFVYCLRIPQKFFGATLTTYLL
jgi:hypothetical protein